MYVRQAVILVGGQGTRLGPLTRLTPKPLLEIAPGLRFLDAPLFELARHGITDIVLLAGHLGDQVHSAYDGKQILDAHVRVIREPSPQGTGGALHFARDLLDPWFVMANGDSLFEINLRALTQHLDDTFDARLALRHVPDPGRYGSVSLEGENIVGFREKDPMITEPGLINGGIYVVNRRIVDRLHGPCSIEQDVFPPIAARGRLRGVQLQGYFLDIGLPNTYEQARAEIPFRMIRPCAFLDRDDVLNRDLDGYTFQPGKLQWMPNAPAAVRLLNDAGYLVVVVSNQSGVARGLYTEADVMRFHDHMNQALAENGAHIDALYYCPFHIDGTIERYRITDHPDRKPNPGMLRRAFADLPIRKEGSFLIGDKPSDLEAARAAEIPGFLFTGDDLQALAREALAEAHASLVVQ